MIIKKPADATILNRLAAAIFNSKTIFLLGLTILLAVLFTAANLQPIITTTPKQTFYDQPTNIKLSSTSLIPHQLRYTLDGTEPTSTSNLYDNSIPIEATTVIRAAAFRDQTPVSPVFTFPVFINAEHQLPVVSLATEPSNLWDENFGIYNNYNQKGDDWERPADLSFYEPDGRFGFQKTVGVRIHGGGSRSYPQKSFRIYTEYQDHDEQISYPLFPDLEQQTFNTFLLRAAGGDWEYAFMRDVIMHDLAKQSTNLDTMAARPVVVYLNNQYWGLYYLRERIDQHYFANKYGLARGRLSIVEVAHDVGEDRGKVVLDYGRQQAVTDYNRLFESAQGCTDCAHYNDFAPELDIANLIDYMLLELYSGNFDWPYGNIKLWRYEQPVSAEPFETSIIDGRFRWIFYDLDVGLGFEKTNREQIISSAQNNIYGRFVDDKFPFRNLFFDEKFRQEYLTRAAELFNSEMSPEKVIAAIDKRAASIRPEIPAQVDRWQGYTSPQNNQLFSSTQEWEHNVELMKTYANHRTEAFFNKTADFYELSGVSRITLKSLPENGGGVSIGAIKKSSSELPWQGSFFNESYMAIEAQPNAGYTFDHWQGDIAQPKMYNQRVVVEIDDQQQITAVFRKKRWYQYLIPF